MKPIKRSLSLLTAALMLLAVLPSAALAGSISDRAFYSGVCGDGTVSFVDVSVLYSLLLFSSQITPEQQFAGDINGDGVLSFTDISILYSRLLGVSEA